MEWTRTIDGYCERTDASYWSEPVNALTNIAFLIAAAILWRRSTDFAEGRILSAILLVIGIGSWLFHTHATVWAAIADSTPILAFALYYIYLANRDFWGLSGALSVVGAVAYIPYSMALTPVLAELPFFDTSSYYWPLPILILIYAVLLRNRTRQTAQGLAIGAAILSVSLTFRSIDQEVCGAFPLGTHFLWHLLNAVMLGWMIEVWRRHVASSVRTAA